MTPLTAASNIARLPVVGVAGQFALRHDRLAAARQDGDAVPSLLAAPHGAVARLPNRGLGEFAVGGLKLLQRDDVGLFSAQPTDQITEPLVHVVDVEARYLHQRSGRSWKKHPGKFTVVA